MSEDCNKKEEDLQDQITQIRENHLAHLATDIGDIKVDLATTKTNVQWLMKAFWIVVGASVASLIAAVINMLISYSR